MSSKSLKTGDGGVMLESGKKYIYNIELRRSTIAQVIPQIVDWNTGETYKAGNPEFVEDIQNIGDAFNHFKPKVDVTFTDAEGGAVEETLKFGELRDFEAQGGKGKLVQNSAFLSGVKEEIDTNAKIRKSIEQNRKLRDILKDAGSREEMKALLQSMLDELEA